MTSCLALFGLALPQESICLGLPAGAPGMREVTPAKTLQQLAKIWDVEADYDAELARCGKKAAKPSQAKSHPSFCPLPFSP